MVGSGSNMVLLTPTAGSGSVALHACRVARLVRRESGGPPCGGRHGPGSRYLLGCRAPRSPRYAQAAPRNTGHTPPPPGSRGHQPGKNRAFLASAPQRLSAPCAARHPSFPGRQLSIHRPAITSKQVTLARWPRGERQRRRAAPLPIWTRVAGPIPQRDPGRQRPAGGCQAACSP